MDTIEIPSTRLYRHASRPKFILMRMCQPEGSGVITAWGKFVHLTSDEVRVKGLDIIRRDLKEFPSRDSSFGSEFTGSLALGQRAVGVAAADIALLRGPRNKTALRMREVAAPIVKDTK